MLHSAIKQFISDVDWGELDYLVVDLPPGTGDVQLSLSQTLELQGGVIVTLPQQVSLDDALRGINMFQEMDVPIFGVIENMSYLETPDGDMMDIFGTGGGEKLAKMAGVPYIGSIPIDPQVGDKELARDRARNIGRVSNRFLITTQGGEDSEYLGWYYNYNQDYQTDPQVQVFFETYAEWEPLGE